MSPKTIRFEDEELRKKLIILISKLKDKAEVPRERDWREMTSDHSWSILDKKYSNEIDGKFTPYAIRTWVNKLNARERLGCNIGKLNAVCRFLGEESWEKFTATVDVTKYERLFKDPEKNDQAATENAEAPVRLRQFSKRKILAYSIASLAVPITVLTIYNSFNYRAVDFVNNSHEAVVLYHDKGPEDHELLGVIPAATHMSIKLPVGEDQGLYYYPVGRKEEIGGLFIDVLPWWQQMQSEEIQ